LCADPPHHLLPRGNKFLAFAVDDLQRATDQLRDKGVPIIWRDKQLAPGIRSTAIRDVEETLFTSCSTDWQPFSVNTSCSPSPCERRAAPFRVAVALPADGS
jgi:hypothetical protein